MSVLWSLLSLPLAPIRGTVWLAEQVLEEAERQHYDPRVVRRKREAGAQARAAGRISPEEAGARERELIGRLIEARRRAVVEE